MTVSTGSRGGASRPSGWGEGAQRMATRPSPGQHLGPLACSRAHTGAGGATPSGRADRGPRVIAGARGRELLLGGPLVPPKDAARHLVDDLQARDWVIISIGRCNTLPRGRRVLHLLTSRDAGCDTVSDERCYRHNEWWGQRLMRTMRIHARVYDVRVTRVCCSGLARTVSW